MSVKFKIGERCIGDDWPPFVIAEVGINHEGDISKALSLADAAARAGADCVKFQCHITEAEMVKTDMKPGNISDEKIWDIIKRCELTYDEEARLKEYCDSRGIIFLSTPFSREAADRLEKFNVCAYKIGSGECNNIPLVKYIAKKKKPIILSTGMNDPQSIGEAVDIVKEYGAPLILMHCTSMYPTPYERVRLGAVQQLKKTFGVPVGLSDHSYGIYTCLGAAALGACALEKHFTLSRKWPGPDISISIMPDELAELVKGSKAIFKARGGSKTVLKEEKPVINFAYASVCTIRPIKKGELLSGKNIWVKRPGTGEIRARDYESLRGKRCRSDLKEGVLLRKDDVVW